LKLPKNTDRFQAAVDYLTDYAGVKGAIISDSEGLLIAKSGSSTFESEHYAAMIQIIVKELDKSIARLLTPGMEYLSIKTNTEWLTVTQTSGIYLTVAAERKADDLLNVRISRSLEMISAHLADKYNYLKTGKKKAAKRSAKNMEGVNV